MAENIENAREGHNSSNRDPEYVRSEIVKLHKELLPIEEEERKLNEKKKKLRNQFKAETGITVADFNAARRLAMMEDEDERKEKRDNLATCYNALSDGDQLDWIEATQQQEAA